MKILGVLCVILLTAGTAVCSGVVDISEGTQKVDIYPYPVEGGLSMAPEGPDSYRFCGWPANGKLFAWGDELLIVFRYAPADGGTSSSYHAVGEGETYTWSARSFDGGENWTDEAAQGAGQITPQVAVPLRAPIDFSNPDLALMIQKTDSQKGPARILFSTDRGRTWNGYYMFPAPGFDPVAARSDYIVEGKRKLRMFSSAGFDGDEDGTTPHQWMTRDGGLTWELLGRTGLDIINLPEWRWSIMPATVKLSDGTFVQTARTKGSDNPYINFHPVHRSTDGGKTWNQASAVFREATPRGGNGYHTPSDLTLIPETDTLVCTYVDRGTPSRVLAKISKDKGLSWEEEIELRKDGGGHDVGYPETIMREDGKFVTIVYWYIKNDPKSWSEIYDPRFLAVTIWDPLDALSLEQ